MSDLAHIPTPYPIQVTNWLRSIEDCDSIVNDLLSKRLSCAIYTREWSGSTRYAVFRVALDDDPFDIFDQFFKLRRLVRTCPAKH